MTTKDEALRLADSLERMSLSTKWDKQAAAELRRLYSANQALLEALTDCVEHMHWTQPQGEAALKKAKAAIAKATSSAQSPRKGK